MEKKYETGGRTWVGQVNNAERRIQLNIEEEQVRNTGGFIIPPVKSEHTLSIKYVSQNTLGINDSIEKNRESE